MQSIERTDRTMKFTVTKTAYGYEVHSTQKYPKTQYLTKIYRGVPEFSHDYTYSKKYKNESTAKKIAAQLSR